MYRFDYQAWPVVVVRRDERHSEEEFRAYLRELDEIVARDEPFALVDVVAPNSEVPSVDRLRSIVRWYENNRRRLAKLCMGSADVIPTAAMRGVANFVVQMIRSDSPRYTAKDEEDAMRWARLRMNAASAGTEFASC